MTNKESKINYSTWQQQAEEYLISENYYAATQFYEQAIEKEPSNRLNYWYLGLILLLQGEETEAQMTWFMVLSETDDQEFYTQELVKIVQTEAQRRHKTEDFVVAWGLLKHIGAIDPQNIDNLLNLLQLAIELDFFQRSDNELLQVIDLLPESSNYNQDLLLETVVILLPYAKENKSVFDFIKICLDHFPDTKLLIDCLMEESIKISAFQKEPSLAAIFAELCLSIDPHNRKVLTHLSYFYQDSSQYLKGIAAAKKSQEMASTIAESLVANYVVIRALMTASGYNWYEGKERLSSYKIIAKQLMESEQE